jgi:proteasome lid subunit RPN8/RPN11
MLSLRIPDSILAQMADHAAAEAPTEACGILAGRNATVERCYRMTNADGSSDHFMMEPAEQFKVVKDIRASALETLAIWHSHPDTAARPSAEDVRLALTPGVACVILSLKSGRPHVKAFEIDDGTVTEVKLEIEANK